MNLSNTIKIILISIVLGLSHNSNAMMGKWLLALTGDAFLAATVCTKALEEEEISNELNKFLPPSIIKQLFKDAQEINPYIPIIAPIGLILSSGSRLGMISKKPMLGLAATVISVPVNMGLMCGATSERYRQVWNNRNIIDKTQDELWHQMNRTEWPEKNHN